MTASPDALAGVVEKRPDGWSYLDGCDLVGVPTTFGAVYGPVGAATPPCEGAGRLALYETIPAGDGYVSTRIAQTRNHDGRRTDVTVNGRPAELWRSDATGELLIAWSVPGKTELLVGNTADFTDRALIESAESVADCCG